MTELLPQPGVFFTLASYILMIGILVFVHEGGHYLAGRWFGASIDSFAFGFGPELFGRTDKRGVRWKLNAIPLGGYVKFTGDMNAASQPDPEIAALPAEARANLFISKPMWQRAIIIAAGPAINFVFAIAILSGFYIALGHPLTPAVIAKVEPGSAAAAAGLRAGDRITAIDGGSVSRFEDIVGAVMVATGAPMALTYERGGSEHAIVVTPRMVTDSDRFGNVVRHGRLGLRPGAQVVETVNPVAAIGYGISDTGTIIGGIATTLKQIIVGDRSVKDLGGPLKTGQITAQAASLGVLSFISFMAFFSINLGFLNLLPIPMLDGGHLFLYAVEAIRRQPLGAKVQEWAFMSGFAALMSVMVILTWSDLGSYGVWERLAGWFS